MQQPHCTSFGTRMRRYLIWQHPEVEARLAAELDDAGLLVTPQRPAPRAMEYADLSRLNYLSWVCKVSSVRSHLVHLHRLRHNSENVCLAAELGWLGDASQHWHTAHDTRQLRGK